ncbi:MAG TPA: hypothetical protein VHX60_00505 [Acidobacteriaceae bacterium]|jgi:hypothetical protein|nr:hypothetical protein [Acidobacteriaceae bacterium]
MRISPARPLLITILGWLLIAVGALEFAEHAARIGWPPRADEIEIALFELVILACGVFLLRGVNAARWLAVGWIAFHVVVGAIHSVVTGIVHGLIFLLFAALMFRPEVNAWFRRRPAQADPPSQMV